MKICFICTGNTCRSPMAEGYLKSFNIPALQVLSRGLYADRSPVSENAQKVMKYAGIDISGRKSVPLCKDDLDCDFFICMSSSHAEALLSAGIQKNRITVLKDGIPDPYGQGEEEYLICRNKIFLAVENLVFSGKIFDFSVLDAKKEDAEDIAKLEEETSSEPWSKKAIEESMDNSTLFYKSVSDGKLSGYIGMSVAADEGYITNVAVFEKYRNNGIATLLLNRVICEARKRNLAFVSLEVRKSNEKAIRIYEKLGFKAEGLRKNFYRNPNEDAIIMTRRF